jgi:FXSXX-COOH protein
MLDDTTEYGDGPVDVGETPLHELDAIEDSVLAHELRRFLDLEDRGTESLAGFSSYIDR